MSSANSSLHCSVDIRPSRRLAALLAVPAIFSAIAVFFSGLPVLLKVFACALVVLLAIGPIRRLALLRGSKAVRRLVCADGGWKLVFENGEDADAVPGSVQFVLPFLMVLNFHAGGRRLPVILLPWNSAAAARRRLSVLLLWLKPEESTS